MKTLGLILSIIGVIQVIYHSIKLFREHKSATKIHKIADSDKITELLNILQKDSNVQNRAVAFISLMQSSYVLVHVLVNKGNDYDDEVQSKLFCKSLSAERIQMLKKLGE